MKVFKDAFRIVRDNSEEIYRGFGFKHLSDATQYYVHPDNQSFSGTTTLCQPIGESLILFSRMLMNIAKGEKFGDYYVSEDKQTVYLEVDVPEDYRENAVVAKNIFRYRAVCSDLRITIAAYNKNDVLLKGNMDELHAQYKLLPVFMVLLACEMEINSDFRQMMDKFIDGPAVDDFVNLHEDFYQNHKADDYNLL